MNNIIEDDIIITLELDDLLCSYDLIIKKLDSIKSIILLLKEQVLNNNQ